VPEIRVNYILAEWLKARFFPDGNPIGTLLVEKMDAKEYSMKYLQGITFTNPKAYFDELNAGWPEEYHAQANRAVVLAR